MSDRTRQNSGLSRVGEFEVVETDVSAATSKAIIVHSRGTGNLFYNQNGSVSGFGTGGNTNFINLDYTACLDIYQILTYDV